MVGKRKSIGRIRRMLPIIGIGIGAFLILFVIFLSGITPDQYDIQVGSPSSKTIYATKDVQDTVTTELLRKAAEAAVEPTYKSMDVSVDAAVLADVRTEFQRLNTLRGEYKNSEINEAVLNEFNEKASFTFTQSMLSEMVSISDDDFEVVSAKVLERLSDALNSYLPEGQEEATAARIIRDISADNYSDGILAVCRGVLNKCIRPNMLIDTETTEANIQKARDSIEPVMLVNREVIVREGEIVTEAEYQMIASLGLLADNSVDFLLFSGLAILDLMFCGLIALYLVLFDREVILDFRKLMLLSLIIIFQMLLCFLIRSFNPFIMPVSLAAMVFSVLFRKRTALFISTIAGFMSALLVPSEFLFSTSMFSIMTMSFVAGPIAVLIFSKRQLRSDTLLAGVSIGAANFVTVMALGMITSANIDTTVSSALWSIGSGVISAVLAIGLQALLEASFNLPTNSRLIELSNPNQKLLKRLLMEAPGTYHHSIIVANLAEAAVSAIGGNGLLARVGAYYHDIGKLKRPMYYKENQIGDNPHDRTDPRVSAAILTAHPRDGAQMAAKERLPEAIIDIIRQHHGDTIALYFYDKAVKLYGDDVDQSSFRYDGPRPKTMEAAVVMLADTIEAATRTLKDPTQESMEALIRKLVNAKLTDGQLNESPLTFEDIDKICSTFITVLTGVFHQRIEYPDISVPERKPVENENEPVREIKETEAENTVQEATETK